MNDEQVSKSLIWVTLAMLQEPAIGEPAGEDRAVATIAEEFA